MQLQMPASMLVWSSELLMVVLVTGDGRPDVS